jgi:hypothetical protein
MPGYLLTTASTIQCPHGGQATLFTSNARVMADGAPVLLVSDVHPVTGCAFTLPGPKPSPCIRIEWASPAGKSDIGGTAPLVKSSVGKCLSAEGAPQGVAIIANTQTKDFSQ